MILGFEQCGWLRIRKENEAPLVIAEGNIDEFIVRVAIRFVSDG